MNTISADSDPANVSNRASKRAIVRGVVTKSSEACELSNVVETALARALLLAAEAGALGRRGQDRQILLCRAALTSR